MGSKKKSAYHQLNVPSVISKWLFYYFATTSIIIKIIAITTITTTTTTTLPLITKYRYYDGSVSAFAPSYINHHRHRGSGEIIRIKDLCSNNNNGDYDETNNNDDNKSSMISTTTATTTTTTTKSASQDDCNSHIPKHVGIICDGNSRWATSRNLPTSFGHAEGGRRLIDLIKSLVESNSNSEDNNSYNNSVITECVTFYAFSTENWNRSNEEIINIYNVLEFTAKTMLLFDKKLLNSLRIQILGDLDDIRIPNSCRIVMKKLVEITNNIDGNNKKKLTICFGVNYGGRRDIMLACKEIVKQVQDGELNINDITEDTISNNLCTSSLIQGQSGLDSDSDCTSTNKSNNNIQNPDLIIRTGGENRLSNFMTWESAYSEIYISNTLWPNFIFDDEWYNAIEWYKKRKRNFGGRTVSVSTSTSTTLDKR
jgi:undecaprenyl diphosphate synthase